MDRDIVNAIHRMYYGEVDRQELLSDLWSPDSEPDLEALANSSDGKLSLPRQLIFFLKAVETQMAGLPNPNFVFSFPLGQRPRKPGEKRPAFVAMPYGPKWSDSVKTIILSAAKDKNFDAEVSGDLDTPGTIRNQIWHGIRRAEVVVADITGSNPNVFYELGLAHALGKEVILLSQEATKPPFDISTQRMLPYEIGDLDQLATGVRSAFEAVSARYSFEGVQPYF